MSPGQCYVYVHPDRRGEGPTIWGFIKHPDSTQIYYGKLEGPYMQQDKPINYEIGKIQEKLVKGYASCGSFPLDHFSEFLGAVRKVRNDWNTVPLSDFDPDLRQTLRQVRKTVGLAGNHPSDMDPVRPPPRRADPKPNLAIPSQPKKTVSWMF